MDCQECKFNKNGWCNKYKMQKPKAMIECEKDNQKVIKDDSSHQAYINNGKIQAFTNIIRQIDVNPQCCTDDFKRVLLVLFSQIEFEIALNGIEFDYEIDKDIYNDLKARIKNWKIKYNNIK